MARKREEPRVLRMHGSRSPSARRRTPEAPRGRPEAPEWLSEEGAAEFERLCDRVEELGVLSPLDRMGLSILADSLVFYRKLRARLDREGLVVPGRQGGTKKHPASTTLDQTAKRVRGLLKEFGLLGPASRRGLLPPGPGGGEGGKGKKYFDH